jgi:hypothetical protein
MIRYQPKYRVGTIRYEGETNVGVRGPAGPGLEFVWDGTRLGVREAGQSAYQYVDLLGPGGKQGETGPQGKQGERGGAFTYDDFTPEQLEALRGPRGYTGATGPQGEQGIPGERGAQGAQGIPGERGERGETGATGATGPPGEQGPKGERGDGFSVLGYYDSLSALQAAVRNPDPGDGYGVGTAAPYDIYIWDPVGSAWRNNGPLQGAKGDPGERGPQGIQGEQGPEGPKGDTGDTGPQGPQGIQGERGLQGERGETGAKGDPGYTPQRGVDYWTSADRQSMVQDVLAALPVYQGEVSSV